MTGVLMSSCPACGTAHFPRRLACPRCHHGDLTTVRSDRGVVEEVTLADTRLVASVRTDLGPTVVASFPPTMPEVRPGEEVRLDATPDGVATGPVGFVPDPAAAPAAHPVPPAERTLPELLDRQAARYGEKVLLRAGAVVRSYREVRDAAAGTAGTLHAAGVGRGERVAVMAPNRVEVLDVVLGCAWLGAVAVPLNVALRGEGLRHVLVNSGARVLVLEPGLLEVLDTVDVPASLEEIWLLPGDDAVRPPTGPPTVRAYPGPATPVPAADVTPGETAAILYTSGTTGVAKGVCCPHAQFYWWGVNVSSALAVGPDDVLYTVLPLFHTNALNAFVQALVSGASFVLGSRFSASRFWAEVRDADATVTYLLGAMVNFLHAREPSPEDRAHRVRIALAPATPAALHQPFQERFGVTLVEGFGSTETNMTLGAPVHEQRPGRMGRPLPGFDAMVVDDDDQPVPAGTPGELVLRNHEPYAFATGYFGMPEATVKAWRNLWFHTGDRVVCDADGWFTFVDRTKDAIRRRGENISSFEVEQAIRLHPAVQDAAVYAVPSEFAEDEVAVALVLGPGRSLAPQDLVDFLEPRLAAFAIPRFVRFLDALPVTENGKVRKQPLRDAGVTPDAWDRTSS